MNLTGGVNETIETAPFMSSFKTSIAIETLVTRLNLLYSSKTRSPSPSTWPNLKTNSRKRKLNAEGKKRRNSKLSGRKIMPKSLDKNKRVSMKRKEKKSNFSTRI